MVRNVNRQLCFIKRQFCKMRENGLGKVSEVDIDPVGTFKYILVKIYAKAVADKDPHKMIVRGYKACGYHSDIFKRASVELEKLQLEGECVGGGKIKHEPEAKRINVYGYSQGYGKADHEMSVSILKKVYKDYDITCSDDGD